MESFAGGSGWGGNQGSRGDGLIGFFIPSKALFGKVEVLACKPFLK